MDTVQAGDRVTYDPVMTPFTPLPERQHRGCTVVAVTGDGAVTVRFSDGLEVTVWPWMLGEPGGRRMLWASCMSGSWT